MDPEKYTSQCLICGKMFYDEIVEKCTKCGGRCKAYDNRSLHLMGRYSIGAAADRCALATKRGSSD